MKRIGMGIVGAGFVGPHHVDAVRRLGYVDVVAVAGSSEASAREEGGRARRIERAYGSYEALLDDPDVQVVHNATPNYLHYPVNAAALAQGQARRLRQAAGDDGGGSAEAARSGDEGRRRPRRDLQLPRQPARAAGAARDRARRHRHAALPRRPVPAGLAAQGHRLLVAARARQGRRLVGARRHRLALVRSRPARQRPAHHARARRHHDGHPEAQAAEGLARGVRRPAAATTQFDLVDIEVEDLASVLLRFDNGAKGAFSVGQVCAGHKNDLVLEICGSKASLRWTQEQQNELWIGHRDKANEILQKDPSLHRRRSPRLRAPARRPPGGVGGRVLQPDARHLRLHRRGRKPSDTHPPAFATFEDGYRANCIVEAILESAKAGACGRRSKY